MINTAYRQLTIALFFIPILSYSQEEYTLSGYVREAGSQELLPGVTIYFPAIEAGTTTNLYGFYSITLPGGSYDMRVSFVGYELINQTIDLSTDKTIHFNLNQANLTLEGVTINAERDERLSEEVQMSLLKIPVEQFQDIPSLMGEKDVLKTLQLMPGVQSGTEGSSGLYVRGGGADQNLIILDDAIVYNASHLFGFFSVFNGDALKSVELYKGGFPARFGGRLSSVINMTMKDGSKEHVQGKAGIGLISSNVTVEGPINEKSSFLISGRRTYIDLLLAPLLPADSKGGYFFHDFNAKYNYDFGPKNRLFVSGYFGRDKFWSREKYEDGDRFNAGIGWGNGTGTIRWNHLFNNKLFANTSFIYSNFSFKIDQEDRFNDNTFRMEYLSKVEDMALKFDVDYLPNPNHTIKAGANAIYHQFSPRAFVLEDTQTSDFRDSNDLFDNWELAAYVEDEFKPIRKLSVNAGIRLTFFSLDGDAVFKPEPRISMAYTLKDNLALKGSYARMNQYVHLLTNSGIGLPTDLWVPSTKQVKPESSQQIALGLAKDVPSRNLSISIETYYKKSDNVINYKEGATFLDLDDLENGDEFDFQDKVVLGEGRSYGAEFLAQRKFGRVTGWIGYTLSWTKLKFDELNLGQEFFAKYDRRHDLSIVGIYKPNNRITLSAAFVFGSGQAFTLPVARIPGYIHSIYDSRSFFFNDPGVYRERGNFRGESYHRFDISIQFHKKKPKGIRTWELGVYNLYGRKNPFFYYTDSQYNDGTVREVLRRQTIFPLLLSISYKFEF